MDLGELAEPRRLAQHRRHARVAGRVLDHAQPRQPRDEVAHERRPPALLGVQRVLPDRLHARVAPTAARDRGVGLHDLQAVEAGFGGRAGQGRRGGRGPPLVVLLLMLLVLLLLDVVVGHGAAGLVVADLLLDEQVQERHEAEGADQEREQLARQLERAAVGAAEHPVDVVEVERALDRDGAEEEPRQVEHPEAFEEEIKPAAMVFC